MVYFVMNHASGDDDTYARRFFDDLSDAVEERVSPRPHRKVGYYDHTDPEGERWPADARLAVTTGQTMIGLLSERFLHSDRCGRSWAVFADRLRQHELSTGRRYPGFIPIIWNSLGISMSALASCGIHFGPHLTPGGEDLRVLIRLRRHRADYRAFVSSLSRRVVETAHGEKLLPSPKGTELADAPNAFAASSEGKRIILVVVADTKEQMRAFRNDLQFYGMRREDWAPYQPSFAQPLVNRAKDLAAQRLIASEVVSIEALGGRLEGQPHKGMVILLVDAWTTRMESWRPWLAAVGQRHDAEIAVLVPLNADDAETCSESSKLRNEVLKAFPRRAGPRDLLFHLGIDSAGAFDSDLASTLAAVVNTRRSRPPSTSPRSSRPILGNP